MRILEIQPLGLEEFYRSHGDNFMSTLIEQLRRSEPRALEVFCLTSVYQLCLLNEAAYDSTKNVTVDSDRKGTFEIEYLLSEGVKPNDWTHYRKCHVNGVEQALQTIREGMKVSKGWSV